MDSKVELLSPAGDYDSFLAAVENGADAVYLGAKNFSARQNASNFEGEELRKALDYAHARDVSVYLAINTLISDNEMKDAFDIACKAYKDGIDGLIVQDIGFAKLVRRHLPGLDLHASTQMTVYNIDGVKMLEEFGFKRVVLARELSLDEIRAITAATSLDVEIFI
ncbi:MAG TPA: peptidase U32 family protein, partial [Clostridia bacterium]